MEAVKARLRAQNRSRAGCRALVTVEIEFARRFFIVVNLVMRFILLSHFPCTAAEMAEPHSDRDRHSRSQEETIDRRVEIGRIHAGIC